MNKKEKKDKKLEKNAPKPAVVFDFDGTLMDSAPAVLATYRHILEKHGLSDQITKEYENVAADISIENVMREFFPEKEVPKVTEEFLSYQRSHLIDLIQPTKDVNELLSWLKKEGYKTAVISSRARNAIVELLKDKDMTNDIDVIIGGADATAESQFSGELLTACRLLGAEHCVYISDDILNLTRAKYTGAFTIAFVRDGRKTGLFVEVGPDFMTPSMKQVKKVLKSDPLWLAYDLYDPSAEGEAPKKEKKVKKEEPKKAKKEKPAEEPKKAKKEKPAEEVKKEKKAKKKKEVKAE